MKKQNHTLPLSFLKRKMKHFKIYEVIKNLVKLILQLSFKFQTFLLKLRIETIYKFIDK